MPEPKENTTEKNELHPLYTMTASKLNFLQSLVFAFIFAGICAFVLGPLADKFRVVGGDAICLVRTAGGFFCVLSFLSLLSPFLSYGVCQKMDIYEDRIKYRSGFFWRESKVLPLSRITGVEISESLWQRLIGTGNITIWAGSLPRIVFIGAKSPERKAEYLRKLIEMI